MEWIRQREPREQLVLGLGTLLAVAILGWTFVWTPLRDGAGELDAEVAQRAREVVDLRRAAELRAGTAAPAAIDTQNLLFLANETAQTVDLASTFTRTNPDGNDAVNVTFRDARFDSLIGWLIGLERDYGVAVASATFTRSSGSGLVNGTVRIERF